MTNEKLFGRLAPQQIDAECIAFNNAKAAHERTGQDLSTQEGVLLAEIQTFGFTPAHAEKTTRLEGLQYVADATVASTVEVDEAVVAELQSELSRLKKPRIFSTLFERKVKHALKKGAPDQFKLQVNRLPEKTQAHLLGLFARCFKVETKAPSVTVESMSVLREKEEKAVQKAARAAAKSAKKGRAK